MLPNQAITTTNWRESWKDTAAEMVEECHLGEDVREAAQILKEDSIRVPGEC